MARFGELPKHPAIKTKGGVKVKWSGVNQAYIIMWHDSVLAIKSSYGEMLRYVKDIGGLA